MPASSFDSTSLTKSPGTPWPMAAPMPAPAAAPIAIPATGKTKNTSPPIRPPTTAPASVALLASFLTSNEPSALWVTTAVSSKWIPPCFSTPRSEASACSRLVLGVEADDDDPAHGVSRSLEV